MTSPADLVLVAEDESIIAMAIQDELEDAGYAVAGPFATGATALRWLDTGSPDFGVLDTNLRDGSSRALARELIRRRVSFVVYSGYRQAMNTVAEFEHAPWIEKPSPAGTLTRALADLRNAKARP